MKQKYSLNLAMEETDVLAFGARNSLNTVVPMVVMEGKVEAFG
jgi:hypothetical protein